MSDVFHIGTQNRTVGQTKMNAQSSRSHSLFMVTIFQRNCSNESTRVGKMYFVDLAGSEKLKKTGVEGQGLEEAKNINKSLMSLGMVINALTENKTHIPYRDSKLTRILQESLGGNSLTTLIIACSLSADSDKETLSTLRFGYRAKAIKNKVVVNSERSAKELLLKLNEAEEKIKHYQDVINKFNSGSLVLLTSSESNSNNKSEDNQRKNSRSEKCEDCSTITRKLLNQHIELVSLQDEYEKVKQEKDEIESEMQTRSQEIYDLNEKNLVQELKIKLFIEEELKTFNELHLKIEHLFLANQQKVFQTNQLKSILEKAKCETLLLAKSYESSYSNNTNNNANQKMNDFEINKAVNKLEDSLIVINKLEQLILGDNKGLSDLAEFINFRNNQEAKDQQENIQSNNNINLNINKSININIFKHKRNKSMCLISNRKKTSNIRIRGKSQVFKNLSDLDFNTTNDNNESSNNNINNQIKDIEVEHIPKFSNSFGEEHNISLMDKSEDIFKENVYKNLHFNHSANEEYKTTSEFCFEENENIPVENLASIIKKQRKTITELTNEFITTKDSLFNIKKEHKEKESILTKNNETVFKLESDLKVAENRNFNLEKRLAETTNILENTVNELEQYKKTTMDDFAKKEQKMLSLVNRVSDLEDENYRLLNSTKDKDKKRLAVAEKQVKELSSEIHKVLDESKKLKVLNEKKDQENKNYVIRVKELENQLAAALISRSRRQNSE